MGAAVGGINSSSSSSFSLSPQPASFATAAGAAATTSPASSAASGATDPDLSVFSDMMREFEHDLRRDEDLVRLAERICKRLKVREIEISPATLNPTKEDLLHFKTLENLPTSHLQVRFAVLQDLNSDILGVRLRC